MEIHYIVAQDMRKALLQVKKKLGPDALIISHKSVDGGVEVQAAIEREVDAPSESIIKSPAPEVTTPELPTTPDISAVPEAPIVPKIPMVPETSLTKLESEITLLRSILENQVASLAWQQEKYARPIDAVIIEKLQAKGFPKAFCQSVLNCLGTVTDVSQGIELFKNQLSSQLPEVSTDIIKTGGIAALVGPTGVGKTTTLAKLATKFVFMHSHKDIAIINADNYRIGAKDQLTIYARILNVPIYNVANVQDLDMTLNKLRHKKLVLIDTSGVILETNEIIRRIYVLQSNAKIDCYLTLSASTAFNTIQRTIDLFSCLPINGCILTKLDEISKMGELITLLVEKQLSLAYFSDGQRVPEDIHIARSKTLINNAFREKVSTMKAPLNNQTKLIGDSLLC